MSVPFAELARGGSGCEPSVSYFSLDYLSEHTHSHTNLIILAAQNLPFYLNFSFICLYG